jgi:hypothetical protein
MRDWRRWALIGVTLWIVAVTFWALHPISANVRTGVNADGTEKNAVVECDSPLSGNTSPTADLPTLGAGESFGSAPCKDPVTSGRTMYAIDIVVAVGVVLLVIAIGRRSERRTGTDHAAAQTSSASA